MLNTSLDSLVIGFLLVLMSLLCVSIVYAGEGIQRIGPEHRQWTTGPVFSNIPLDIGPESREWTFFGKDDQPDRSSWEPDQSEGTSDETPGEEKPDDGAAPATNKPDNGEDTQESEEEILIRFDTRVFFQSSSVQITADAESTLEQVVDLLEQHSEVTLTLQGHTNRLPINTPEFSSNQELSLARAEAVRDYLIDSGIDPGRLQAEGYGDSKPRVSNDSARALEINRRVDLLFQSDSVQIKVE